MMKDVMSQATAYRTANETWKVVEGNFTSAKRARTVNSRVALATTKKEDISVEEYVNKMCFLGDELSAVVKQINDDELISYIFADLDQEYNTIITTLLTKETLTIGDVYSQLLNFEQCLALQRATHGRGTTRGRGGPWGGGRA
jgi:ribosomal protein L17